MFETHCGAQSGIMPVRSTPIGPTTAILAPLRSGSTPSFRSSTKPCSAASCVTCRCAELLTASSPSDAHATLSGGSKRPAAKSCVYARRHAASTFASVVRPSPIASPRLYVKSCEPISRSTPALSACAADETGRPWGIAPQSVPMSTSCMPHCSRITSFRMYELPHARTPLISS